MGRAGSSDISTPALGALVAAALLLATTTLMAVTIVRANAAGALAVGTCGSYGQAYDFPSPDAAKDSALGQCQGSGCRVVETFKRGCAAFAVDGTNPCGARGFGKASRLGQAQNVALKACYKDGGKDCVIRTFLCDAKG